MYSREHRTVKTSSQNADTPMSNQFAPRPFVYQPKIQTATPQAEQTTDLQAKSENSEPLDHCCINGAVLTGRSLRAEPRPIQLLQKQHAIAKRCCFQQIAQAKKTSNPEEIASTAPALKKTVGTPPPSKSAKSVHSNPFEAAALLPNPDFFATDRGIATKILAGKEFYNLSDDGSKKKAKPQSQDLLVSVKLEKDGGYIVFSNLGNLWVAKENLTEVKSGFKKVDTPLFPPEPRWKPSPDDVRQTGLGDCYLEAALASIAAQKPDYIKEIVREDQDSNVTVRLYKVDHTDYQHPKFMPQYIKVEKSVPINKLGTELYNNGALWVRMIQKAYAAGGFTGTGLAPVSKNPAYENIDGGLSSYAFEVLLGKPSTTLDLKSGPTYNKNKKQYEDRQDIVAKDNTKQIITPNKVSLPWDTGVVTEYEQVKSSKTPDDYSSMKLLMGIFKNDLNKVDQWITFLKGVKGNNLKQKFVDQSNDRASIDIRDQKLEGNSNAITLKDIDELLKYQAFKDDMMQWLQAQQLFPGELGTAIYSQTQLDTFEKIKVALNSGQVVAASSYSSLGKETEAEEKTPDGVSSGHAYSVLAVRTTNSQNPEDQKAGKFNWVKLCDPWQKNGRKSRFPNGKLEVIEDQSNDLREFWLELSDLTKYYYRIDIGSFPNK